MRGNKVSTGWTRIDDSDLLTHNPISKGVQCPIQCCEIVLLNHQGTAFVESRNHINRMCQTKWSRRQDQETNESCQDPKKWSKKVLENCQSGKHYKALFKTLELGNSICFEWVQHFQVAMETTLNLVILHRKVRYLSNAPFCGMRKGVPMKELNVKETFWLNASVHLSAYLQCGKMKLCPEWEFFKGGRGAGVFPRMSWILKKMGCFFFFLFLHPHK